MGEATLVDSKLADSIKLIQTLDAANNAATICIWYFYDDVGEWRLLLAGPTFDALLPKQEAVAYRKLAEAVAKLSPCSLSISDLKLIRSTSTLAKSLAFLVKTDPKTIARAHFTNLSLNGLFIKEMIILRSA